MGGQKGIALFNRYLAQHVPLSCVTTKNNDPGAEITYEVLNLLSNNKLRYINLFYFFSIRKIISNKKITHLIIEHPYYGWLGILLKWFCRVKLVIHSHNIESMRFKSTGKWWWGILWHYEKLAHKNADLNFFIKAEDLDYAITKFKLNKAKCFTITYGSAISQAPSVSEKMEAKAILCSNYQIDHNDNILLFNGTLDYQPNLDALETILEKINPLLQVAANFSYKIIICGKHLPARYNELSRYKNNNIIYAGFVDDINLYFKGADIFINPVIEGGGIKTKVVEALGYDMSVISTRSGAFGIPVEITGEKLKVVEDNQWETFANQVIHCQTTTTIPPAFFDHFYWGNIAVKAANAIEQC